MGTVCKCVHVVLLIRLLWLTKRMKHYIVMLVLACVSMSSYAVNPIKEGNMIAGHVIVKGTEEGIPFATVMILGTNRGAVSNEEGQFEFRKLAAGKYTLRVQVMGYKTQEKQLRSVQRLRPWFISKWKK